MEDIGGRKGDFADQANLSNSLQDTVLVDPNPKKLVASRQITRAPSTKRPHSFVEVEYITVMLRGGEEGKARKEC